MNRIQIAGVLDETELRLLLSCDVDDIAFPVGPGVRTPDLPAEEANRLAKTIAAPKRAVAIVYLHTFETLAAFFSTFTHFTAVQLHHPIELEELKLFRTHFTHLTLFQSLAVGRLNCSAQSHQMKECAPYVDYFFADTWDAETGAFGATGKVHNWHLSRELVKATERPFILAGGLNANNVAEAIEVVRPAAVDVHTGVEDITGRKTRELVNQFSAKARAAFSQCKSGT